MSLALSLSRRIQLFIGHRSGPVPALKHSHVPRYVHCRNSHFKAKNLGTIFEITDGVGGSEAMIFADELVQVYSKFFTHKKWSFSILSSSKPEPGVRKTTKIVISSPNVFQSLIQEAGVHRVQRVPKTERQGRMHTSTITVAVTPESILDIKLNDKDLEMQTMRATGPGGQFVNKTESAVRLKHKPSGIAVEAQESRHQIENRKIAMQKLLTKIRELELEKLSNQISSMKRTQVGNADRNEKIRTYNFPQDRITDHRLGKSYYNLRRLFDGDMTILERIIEDFTN